MTPAKPESIWATQSNIVRLRCTDEGSSGFRIGTAPRKLGVATRLRYGRDNPAAAPVPFDPHADLDANGIDRNQLRRKSGPPPGRANPAKPQAAIVILECYGVPPNPPEFEN